MPLEKLIDFLEENNVKFTRIIHSKAYTAQVIAHRAHISGNMLAKTVVLKDQEGEFVMAVVPANYQVNLKEISAFFGKDLVLRAVAYEHANLRLFVRLDRLSPSFRLSFGYGLGLELKRQ